MGKNAFRSVAAILSAIIVIFILSHAMDTILESNGLMKLPFADNSLAMMIFVVLYRNVFVMVGGYVAARLAPEKPLQHAVILAWIGTALGIAGAVAMWHEPPHWYPILLIILGWPSAWLGGKLRVG